MGMETEIVTGTGMGRGQNDDGELYGYTQVFYTRARPGNSSSILYNICKLLFFIRNNWAIVSTKGSTNTCLYK